MKTKKVNVGYHEYFETSVYREPIEIDIPEEMTLGEYMDSLDEDDYEELHEKLREQNIKNDEIHGDTSEVYLMEDNRITTNIY